MINSILRNLLSNAVKFTKKGGKVVGKAREIEKGMVEISVTDTGVGIPGNTVGKLFMLGEKVGSKGTDNEPSTGLGLVLCKEFVEKHGGQIWMASREILEAHFILLFIQLTKIILNYDYTITKDVVLFSSLRSIDFPF
jgi:signal transduction histidine kinase